MAMKKKASIGRTIKSLFFLVPSLFRFVSHLAMLIKLEARLAGKSLITVLICSILFASLLVSTWLCVLALIFTYLVSLNFSAILSLFIILMLNLFLLIIVAFIISKAKKNMLFPETSRQISRLTWMNDD